MDYLQKGKAKLEIVQEKNDFSGKYINEEDIYKENAIIDGITMKLKRLHPFISIQDPLANVNEGAGIKKKPPAYNMITQEGIVSSDSVQETSHDAGNEGPSATKRPKYEGEPSTRRRR